MFFNNSLLLKDGGGGAVVTALPSHRHGLGSNPGLKLVLFVGLVCFWFSSLADGFSLCSWDALTLQKPTNWKQWIEKSLRELLQKFPCYFYFYLKRQCQKHCLLY